MIWFDKTGGFHHQYRVWPEFVHIPLAPIEQSLIIPFG